MIRIFLFMILSLPCTESVRDLHAQSADWTLKKDDNGIKVYTRPADGDRLDDFRGEASLTTTLDRLVKVFQDADNLKSWIPDCSVSRLIKRDGTEQYHYLVSSLPFPLNDRDTYVHFKYIYGDNWVKIIINGIPDYGAEESGLVRIPYLVGFWMLKKESDNLIHVTYQLQADPGGSVPKWLANSTTVSTPYNTLKNLREYVD